MNLCEHFCETIKKSSYLLKSLFERKKELKFNGEILKNPNYFPCKGLINMMHLSKQS